MTSVSPLPLPRPSSSRSPLPHTPTPMPSQFIRRRSSQRSSTTSASPSINNDVSSATSSLPSLDIDDVERRYPNEAISPATIISVATPGDVQNAVDEEEEEKRKQKEEDKERGMSVSSVSGEEDDIGGDEGWRKAEKNEESEISVWFARKKKHNAGTEDREKPGRDNTKGWMMKQGGKNCVGDTQEGALIRENSRRLPRPKAFIVMKGKNAGSDGGSGGDGENGESNEEKDVVTRSTSDIGPRKTQWRSAVKHSSDEVRKGPVEFVEEDERTEHLRKYRSACVVRGAPPSSVTSLVPSMEFGGVGDGMGVGVVTGTSPRQTMVLRSDDFVEFMKVAAEKTRKKHRKKRPMPIVLFSKAHKLWRNFRSK